MPFVTTFDDVMHHIWILVSADSRVYIIVNDDILEALMTLRKSDPINVQYEAKAKNLLKAELKRRGVTYAQLAERLSGKGVQENERNLNNKISRGGFSAAFMILCLESIGCPEIRL